MQRIGFVGLGLMGRPMALRLIGGGYSLTVWNRTREKATPVLDAGAAWADSPAAVALASDVVFTMVTDSAASVAVATGPDGIIAGAHPGLIHVDSSSIEPHVSRAIAEREAGIGIRMLDAPVTGSTRHAAEGQLGIMVGGPAEAFEECRPIFERLAAKIVYGGASGSGTTLKLISNVILGIATAAVGEALVFATRVGIDPRLLYEITSVGGSRTAAMESRGPRMLRREFAPHFTIANQHKDLTNALAVAQEAGVPLPLGSLARELFRAARAQGKGELDSSAVVTVFEGLADTTVVTSDPP
ncbi:MAG: NAD(P)-dependent oxidoreductase [Chloroflexi bacterium]|nr:NAD(P)-dependent oxidoreductase [Chloroflexota bacterium]